VGTYYFINAILVTQISDLVATITVIVTTIETSRTTQAKKRSKGH